jgi:biopolymer transport protein ExbD
MARFRDSGEGDGGEATVDMSPLIDCVFILLIFFIVTTTFVEETGVEVNKPDAATASSLEKNSVLIALTAEGQVIYGGKEIGISGVQREVKRALAADQDVPVIVQADKDSKTDLLIRIIDEAKLADAKKISVATRIN